MKIRRHGISEKCQNIVYYEFVYIRNNQAVYTRLGDPYERPSEVDKR